MINEWISECTLDFYNEIAILDEDKDVYLVQNKLNNKIFVKKVLETYDIDVYQNLKEHPHKNIPKTYELIEMNDQLIVVEEFINGKNLEEVLNEKGKLSEGEVEPILSQILDGLDHIHSLHPPVIHRDIKLSNIMVTNDGVVKIIDFNTSRLYDKNDSKDTMIMGTAGYAAPEQYGFAQTDRRSDIYALGILVNYLLTGKHPQEEIHNGKYRKVIEKCTNLSPNKRFASIDQLRVALGKGEWNLHKAKGIIQSLWPIPGFRTKQKWKMVVALIGYLSIFSMALTTETTYTSPVMNIIDRILFLLMLLTLLALYTNYRDIQSRLPLCRSEKLSSRILGCTLFTPVVVVVYAFLAGILLY